MVGYIVIKGNKIDKKYVLAEIKKILSKKMTNENTRTSFPKIPAEKLPHGTSLLAIIDEKASPPFWSLSEYIEFAHFHEKFGYYTNNAKLAHNSKDDFHFTTQIHNGFSFALAVLLQAFHTWKELVADEKLGPDQTFNFAEPGAGTGLLCCKILRLIDRMDFANYSPENTTQSWETFVNNLKIHLSDISLKHVKGIIKNIELLKATLKSPGLVDKVVVSHRRLQELDANKMHFCIIQEVLDDLPVDKIIKRDENMFEVAMIVPVVEPQNPLANTEDDKELRKWFDNNNKSLAGFEKKKLINIKKLNISSTSLEQLKSIKWVEVYVGVELFPKINRLLKKNLKFYEQKFDYAKKGDPILIRKDINECLMPLVNLMGSAVVYDYGQIAGEFDAIRANEIRVFPKDDMNSEPVSSGLGFFLGARKVKKEPYLISPGKYNITSNVDFDEVSWYMDHQISTAVICGPQGVIITDHIAELIESMPDLDEDFCEQFRKAYLHINKIHPSTEFSDRKIPYWLSILQFIKPSTDFKMLVLANNSLEKEIQNFYNVKDSTVENQFRLKSC